jgi:hypothetical protein
MLHVELRLGEGLHAQGLAQRLGYVTISSARTGAKETLIGRTKPSVKDHLAGACSCHHFSQKLLEFVGTSTGHTHTVKRKPIT